MRANRAMWMAAALIAGAMIGRANAADSANEAVVRRLVVSIPDRKLAVIENNEVVEVFAVAVGAPDSPSPPARSPSSTELPTPLTTTPEK